MYDELIKALRCEQYGDDECENAECPFWSELGCRNGVANRDAADEIERLRSELTELQKRIEALQHANGKMFRGIEELRVKNETYRKLILLSTGEINELRFKLHLDDMEIDIVSSIEDLKVPSGKENAHDPIRPN